MIPKISDEQWMCATVYMEARGEPYEGKLGVAFVILNRSRAKKQSISDVCLSPWQFSAWNTNERTRLILDTIVENDWQECARAVKEALSGTASDPTHGANSYLNKDVVIRVAGKLPSWYSQDKVTVTIGLHTFLIV